MQWQPGFARGIVLVVILAAVLALPRAARSQGSGGGSSSGGPVVTTPQAGVVVNAEGVLEKKLFPDPTGQLMRERIQAARAAQAPELRAISKLRKVSLPRLERAILDKNGVPTDAMRNLAGLLRVRYVFYYPDSKDIVLAGPAEGWYTDLAGRVVGLTSRRPVIQLQDLVVAMRAFPPGGEATPLIGCSIDPTQEGLAAMRQFLASFGSTFQAGQEDAVLQQVGPGLRSSLGYQRVSVQGVSPRTHFAQVLVEADYRMKLIGIGLEEPPVRLVSFVDRARPSRNALFRWFFVPDYQCLRMTEDHLAMELVGDGVKLVGEHELVSSSGQRTTAGRVDRASQMFVTSFTKKYPELADRAPIYAELRNLIDLAVVAAHLQQQDYYGKAEWKAELLGSEKGFSVEVYPAPQQVEPALAVIFRGSTLMTPIGGGVHIEARRALDSENVRPDAKGNVSKLRDEVKPELAKGQWWWD
jgi:hypothetical protein